MKLKKTVTEEMLKGQGFLTLPTQSGVKIFYKGDIKINFSNRIIKPTHFYSPKRMDLSDLKELGWVE